MNEAQKKKAQRIKGTGPGIYKDCQGHRCVGEYGKVLL